jgi:hypothetical protein
MIRKSVKRFSDQIMLKNGQLWAGPRMIFMASAM